MLSKLKSERNRNQQDKDFISAEAVHKAKPVVQISEDSLDKKQNKKKKS